MRQQLLSVGLLILVGGGCAIAAPAWPNGYREAICAATDHVRAADDAFADAADGIAGGDTERVAIAAAGMERASDDALHALDAAREWAPGAELLVDLRGASIAFSRAGTEFGVGARQGDGPALDRAMASAQEADAGLAHADQQGERLRNIVGWKPC